jgi:hypothetical protein
MKDTQQYLFCQYDYRYSNAKSALKLQYLDELIAFSPELIKMIERDLDYAAKLRKHQRILKATPESAPLPNLDIGDCTPIDNYKLGCGRLRVPIKLILAVYLLTGPNKGFNSNAFQQFSDNIWLHSYLNVHFKRQFSKGLPVAETFRKLINDDISIATHEAILECMCKYARAQNLDDFALTIGDSTHVVANSRKPSDMELVYHLAIAIYRIISKCSDMYQALLSKNDLKRLTQYKQDIALLRHNFNLNALDAEQKQRMVKTMLKKHYQFTSFANRILDRAMSIELNSYNWRKQVLNLELELMRHNNLIECIQDCSKFDFNGSPKILSRSDLDASWIVKSRNAIPYFGYRTQILSSKKGMITAVITPKGNRQDNDMMIGLAEKQAYMHDLGAGNTYCFDDGYTSKKNLDWALANDKRVVFKGRKAFKLIGESYHDQELKDIRNERSIIEGQISRLKQYTNFGKLTSRGHERVQKELLRKANCANLDTLLRLEKLRKKATQIA